MRSPGPRLQSSWHRRTGLLIRTTTVSVRSFSAERWAMSAGIQCFSIEELYCGGESAPRARDMGRTGPPNSTAPRTNRGCAIAIALRRHRRHGTARETGRGVQDPAVDVPNQVTPSVPKRGSVIPLTQLFPMNLRNQEHAPLERKCFTVGVRPMKNQLGTISKLEIERSKDVDPSMLDFC
ncbi:hypothetical protein Sinac_4975 [Singulisphaera acidiphila DSM 18658]|uniref:Uncharacterized protein n=1 Tax=Singulisphaera acidiphila (strain ATCC BAA-1392 / DSM 18658 / VKM B-2454 / MOB10) TaxID=886293 RepID=L0DKE7_SINAD|nr:hypothetical protein Sinac_4975 [Singulisphaera acidiphila DSM 18658]